MYTQFVLEIYINKISSNFVKPEVLTAVTSVKAFSKSPNFAPDRPLKEFKELSVSLMYETKLVLKFNMSGPDQQCIYC